MKNPKFSHKTPHLKGKQHQLDPNLDLKQLVHHATVQYVDRDADGDVDVYDNPKKDTPDENPKNINVGALSKKLLAKQKGELKHTRRGMAYEGNLHKWFKSSSSKDGKSGWVNVVTGGSCASDEPGEGTPKCVSSAKRASMSKSERLSASRRKKEADPSQQQKTGAAKPTYVSTDSPKKMKEEKEEKRYCQVCQKMETRNECSYGPEVWDKMTVKNFKEAAKQMDHEYSMARSELSTVINAAKRLKKKMNKGEGNVEAWVQSKITKAADYLDSAADYVDSGEMSEESDVKGKGSGKKDACYNKVKSRYSVWPSAYASGALVKCRKVGAANWGNKSQKEEFEVIYESGKKCWPGYKKAGTQKLFGKTYNRCVKEETCPVCGFDPCQCLEGNLEESVRIPSKTGNIILVTLMWRGKYYAIKMFFPQVTKPNRSEVQDQIEKVYPGSRVQSYVVSDLKPGEQFLQTSEYVGGSAAKLGPSKSYVKPMGEEVEIDEDWQSVNRKDKTDGLSQAAVNAYRRENPGSKLQTAVTEKKPTGKRAKRRSSFCSRMKGMKSKLTSAETSRDPDSNINKALRRWNCN